jgi:chromosome segregation protein
VLKGLGKPDDFKPGIHGVLASFIEADNSCARAIEAALGTHLQTVLVSDQAMAEASSAALPKSSSASPPFSQNPLSSTHPAPRWKPCPEGATAWALDRVKSDKRISSVIEKLLEKVLIVPNLATALRLRPAHPGVTLVTLAGVILSGEGVLRGGTGAEGSTSVLELQNEVRSLAAEVATLTDADLAARGRVTELEARLEQLREEVEVSRERLQRQKVELSTLQGQLSLATREVENFETKLENVKWERGELENRERAAAEGREHLEDELVSARERLESLETESRRLQSESDAVVRREMDIVEELNELRTELAVERRAKQSAEEQQKPMEARLSELRGLAIRRETEIEAFDQRIEAAQAENARLAEECETHRAEVEDLQVEINTRSKAARFLEAIETAETVLAAVRRDLSKVNEQKGREEVACTKLDLRLESLVTTIQERHQIDLSTFEPDAHALLTSIASQKALQGRGGRQ